VVGAKVFVLITSAWVVGWCCGSPGLSVSVIAGLVWWGFAGGFGCWWHGLFLWLDLQPPGMDLRRKVPFRLSF
jgi:hypothetical protein